jgi:UDP-hydrolysing UDP-N-acetyl-D-glucosamine 2-epimerase
MTCRNVCVVVNSRANYGRIKTVLKSLNAHPKTRLQLIVGASALLDRFGNVSDILQKDGFQIDAKLYSIVEGETLVTMAKSTGLAIIELASLFEAMKPDVVLTVADRFETLATAVAASYLNIPLAHTQGGEVTGSIDESVRHAITKLAHIHFPATRKAADNIIKMGEAPSSVHFVGCPAMDVAKDAGTDLSSDIFSRSGVGAEIDLTKPYLVVLQHPVTTEYGSGYKQIKETLDAIDEVNLQAVWLWPNIDAGSDDISKKLRHYRENKKDPEKIRFFKNFSPEDYIRVLYNSQCIVGNSSSAIREAGFLGVPAVNIGTRQFNRQTSENVMQTDYKKDEIVKGIKSQLEHGPYTRSQLYGDGKAGARIVEILSKATFRIQKTLHYE